MSSCYSFDGLRECRQVIFVHVSIVRGNGKTFPLHARSRNIIKQLVQRLFCRGDLALMYLVELESTTGEVINARLVPMQMRRFRLERASAADAKWMCNLMSELGAKFNTCVKLQGDNSLMLEWS